MKFSPRALVLLTALICWGVFTTPARAAVNSDWTTPIAPFKIADNLYYVGSRDLASYLIVTPRGDILLNSNYTSSPPQIRHSVETLGFHWRDIKILLISHAHVDHAGGSAAIVRETGAKLAVMEGDVDVMESGGRTDFAFGGPHKALQFPPVHVDRTLHDGDEVKLGGVTLIAHRTGGHTRGCTTWTMKVHLPGEPAAKLRDTVIVGSWSVLSEYRLLQGRSGKPPSYPGIASDFAATFATLRALPCDVFLASHGSTFDLLEKLKRMPSEGDRVWVDPGGYKAAVQKAQQAYETIYQRELGSLEQGARR